MVCLNCENIIPKERKFCCKSCAATFNNKKRKHPIEVKRKISKTLGGLGVAKEERTCEKCGKCGIYGERFCSNCYSSPHLHSQEIIDRNRLKFHFYEEKLSKKLERKYGKLKKEIIDGIAYDFCNQNFIIEFTFDYGRGTTDAIKRFENIPASETRKKIIYLPSRYVGEKRKKRLKDCGVAIKLSDEYRNDGLLRT